MTVLLILKYYFFISQSGATSINFLGFDISVWQIVVVPVLLALIELIKYFYRYYIEKNKLRNSNLKNVEQAVQDIIDKSLEKEIDDINLSKEDDNNKHVLSIIKKHLTIIRKNINADRVWIAKFHNGHDNETYVNRSDQLFSIIEESLNYGISSQKKFFYNIPVVFYNFILEKVKNDDYSYIENVHELDPSLNLVLKLQGIKSTGAVGLRNESGELKAIIGYDYIKESKKLNKENVEYIKDNSEIFIEYMQLYNIYKRKLEKE